MIGGDYARNGDIRLAYRMLGDGDFPVVFIPGWVSNVDLFDDPTTLYAALAEPLRPNTRLVVWDKRGTGLSDPVTHVPTIDERMDDLRAVLDAAGVERPAMVGRLRGRSDEPDVRGDVSGSGAFSGALRYGRPVQPGIAGLSMGIHAGAARISRAEIENHWGEGALAEMFFGPEIADVPGVREMFGKEQRAGASPMMARMLWQAVAETDVRAVLGGVRTPTLVMGRRGDRIASFEATAALAAALPNAELRELPPGEHYAIDLVDLLSQAVLEFVGQQADARPTDRVLSTVMFTDIVGSTELLAARAMTTGVVSSTTTTGWLMRCCASSAAGGRSTPATGCSHCSTVPPRRPGAVWNSFRHWPPTASRSVPGCTSASARSAATSGAAWRFTSVRESAPWPARVKF